METNCNHKTLKISDARKLSCNTPEFQIKGPNLRVFLQKDANGIANSEDPDQTSPLGQSDLGLHCLPRNICCGCSLELPQRGISNEHPQHMFL